MKTFVIFNILFSFSFMLASPLIAVYMLKELNLGYQFYGIAIAVATLAKIVFSHPIGKLTDKFGDKPFAIIGHFGTALVPLMFLGITPETIWLVIPVQIYAGLVWAFVDITNYNLLLDLSDARTRALQIAEFNIYANVPRVVAPILGGWMSESITWVLAGIPLIFVLSSIMRFLSTFILFYIKEPRAKQEYPLIYVMRQAMHFHPSNGLVHGMHVVKKRVPERLKQ